MRLRVGRHVPGSVCAVLLALAGFVPAATGDPRAADGADSERTGPGRTEVRSAIDAGVRFLLEDQNTDGSWGSFRRPLARENWGWSNIGTHKGWIAGTTGIVCVTFIDLGDDAAPEVRQALERGLDYLISEGRAKRVSEWDVDNVWGYVYGLEAVARALGDPRIAASPRAPALRQLGQDLIALLVRHQTPGGGWAYYDNRPFTRRPTWATSFTTAATVLGLREAREVGLEVSDKLLARAVRAVKHCRLPNGAYSYNVTPVPSPRGLEGIDQVKGSLSRIQVGNVALHESAAGITVDDVRDGLDLFFRHHKFLAVGRGRPMPHEAYYAVAGYFFFFGHYYAAGAIEALPVAEREAYWARLREKIIETQEADGSMWDFHSHGYHRPYGTAWGVSALQRSLAQPASRLLRF